MGIKCTAKKADGSPCQAWARRGTDRCVAHPPDSPPSPVGAPPGNGNATKHGYYAADSDPPITLDELIQSAGKKHRQLIQYIDTVLISGEADPDVVVRLIGLLGQNTSRLGRLLLASGRGRSDSMDLLEEAIEEIFGSD